MSERRNFVNSSVWKAGGQKQFLSQADGQTLYERRFHSPFDWPIVPCGAEVKVYSFSAKGQGRVHEFRSKIFSELLMCYALNADVKLDW